MSFQVGESPQEIVERLNTDILKQAGGDPVGENHLLLAAIYNSISKTQAKRQQAFFKHLSEQHRHLQQVSRRAREKQTVVSALEDGHQRELQQLRDQQNFRIIQIQLHLLLENAQRNQK